MSTTLLPAALALLIGLDNPADTFSPDPTVLAQEASSKDKKPIWMRVPSYGRLGVVGSWLDCAMSLVSACIRSEVDPFHCSTPKR